MAQRLKNLRVTRVALCGKGMNPGAEIALYKADVAKKIMERGGEYCVMSPDGSQNYGCHPTRAEAEQHLREMEADMMKTAEEPSTPKEALVAENTETVAKADHDSIVAERDALKAKLDELTKPAEEIDKTDLPESVQKALAEADELRARVEKMEQERRAEQFIAKAKDYAHIGAAGELGPVLEAVDRVAPDQAKMLDQFLKAANARIAESGLFKELGSDGPADSDPTAQTDALVKKYMDEEKLSRPDAIRKVFTEHPELWQPAKSVQQ